MSMDVIAEYDIEAVTTVFSPQINIDSFLLRDILCNRPATLEDLATICSQVTFQVERYYMPTRLLFAFTEPMKSDTPWRGQLVTVKL